ncbi:hypothetical protein HJD18_09435 [Thermoleophilia bacterium SCSIO 60948]|nr:hypothetical protein HJD18_09435 [Thermoleophilia bacterium SCSIO 60948]
MTGFSPQGPPPGQPPQGQPGAGGEQPSEEEIRAAMEEQLRQIRVQDLILESVVQIINLTARRLLKEDERDLEQARVGIDSVRALVGQLEGEQAESVKRALSELQMQFVQLSGGDPEDVSAPGGDVPPPAGGQAPPAAGQQQPPRRPGGEPPPRLWTPGRD